LGFTVTMPDVAPDGHPERLARIYRGVTVKDIATKDAPPGLLWDTSLRRPVDSTRDGKGSCTAELISRAPAKRPSRSRTGAEWARPRHCFRKTPAGYRRHVCGNYAGVVRRNALQLSYGPPQKATNERVTGRTYVHSFSHFVTNVLFLASGPPGKLMSAGEAQEAIRGAGGPRYKLR